MNAVCEHRDTDKAVGRRDRPSPPVARASESALDDATMRAVTASAPATTSDGGADARANANAANVADALAYVREVRARFVDESWRYHEFLRAMKAFKRGTCVRARDAMTTHRTTRPSIVEHSRPVINARARRRLTADVVVESVRACLAGHDDLLDGFKAFLPEVRSNRDVASRASRATRSWTRRRADAIRARNERED